MARVLDGSADRACCGIPQAGMPSKEVAAKYQVSRAWVDALKQRRRETGDDEPAAANQVSSARVLGAGRSDWPALITARPDATLQELREALRTTAALSTLWREIDRLAADG